MSRVMAARKRTTARGSAAGGGDEHHLVIDGRRWRRSDPAIPEALRSELVHALMDARRAVRAARRAADTSAEKTARSRVQDAKLALGERGHPYWQAADAPALRRRAAATIRALLARRAARGRTICPSDVARTIGGGAWREQLQLVRAVAAQLIARGELLALQRGREVAIASARGPIRLALPKYSL